jgi:CRISPR/Cas system endoribonuclease Cas6 (RAMP superfamily)
MAEEGLAYAHLLLNRLTQEPVLRLGCHSWAIEAVDLTPSSWSGVQSWADLQKQSTSPLMRFTFATPTAIMKHAGNGARFTALYPDPLTLFGGLAWRWSALAGPALSMEIEGFLQSGSCVIAGYSLHTTSFRTQERTQLGFQGWVGYECRTHELEMLRSLNALARLAFFTGVGYQTMRGMGAVQVHMAQEDKHDGLVGA